MLVAELAQTASNKAPDVNGYYEGHLAQTRARAEYAYESADSNRPELSTSYYWDNYNGSTYTRQSILGDTCAYEENTELNRALNADLRGKRTRIARL